MESRPWSDKDIETLLTLKSSGKTYAEIGEVLGRTEDAVSKKNRQLKKILGIKSSQWNDEETELLIALAETLPRTKLLTTYNQAAVKKNYQKRTMAAINMKLFKLGQSIAPQTGWYSARAIAIGLGFPLSRIHSWIHSGGLKCHKEGKWHYIRNDTLIRWIIDHPDSLKSISEDGLRWFLALLKEDQEMRGHEGRPEYTRALFS